MKRLFILVLLYSLMSCETQTKKQHIVIDPGNNNLLSKFEIDTNYQYSSIDAISAYFSKKLDELNLAKKEMKDGVFDSVYKDYGYKLSVCRIKYLEGNEKVMNNFRHLIYLTQDSRFGKERLQFLFDSYPEEIKKTPIGIQVFKNLNSKVNTIEKSKIKLLFEHEFKSAKGEAFKLGEIKKDYILIDFWASWCGPCIVVNRELVKLYPSMDTSVVGIVGISLDKDINKWINSISREKYLWTNVTDFKGWDSPVVKLLSINGIPLRLLIDKNLNLIKFNPSISYLRDKFVLQE